MPRVTTTPQPDTPDTRDRILDAAERLFVDHGLEATSMRMITSAAKANLAAINYHFGSKDALIQAVFKRRLGALNQARLVALERLQKAVGAEPLQPHPILEAFFAPALSLAADGENGGRVFMRLLSRSYGEPNLAVRQFLAAEFAEVMERFLDALYRALPQVSPQEVRWRFHFMLGAMSFGIAGIDGLQAIPHMIREEGASARLQLRLMSFFLGGVCGPVLGFVPDTEISAHSARGR